MAWGPASAAAQSACAGCVVAGAGRAPLTVPAGTPLAGYGGMPRRLLLPDVLDRYPHAFWLKPGRSEHDGLAARALVLERDGTRVIWVAVDLIAVDPVSIGARIFDRAYLGSHPTFPCQLNEPFASS